jgi:hypothetical membrane protein
MFKRATERYPSLPGSLFVVGAVQFLLMLLVSTSLYPGYNVNLDYISDLGATCSSVGCSIEQPSSIIFNSTTFLFGLLSLTGFLLLLVQPGRKFFTYLGVLSSIGAMGVAIFTEEFLTLHGALAMLALGFGSLTAITAHRHVKSPFSVFGIVMGLAGLAFAAAFLDLSWGNPPLGNTATLGGLGIGAFERLLAYVVALWELCFGVYLMYVPLVERPNLAGTPQR